ncbi:MAG: tetratricopeptide repeat protein [Verrucomicrobiaceae bacterium]|nr:MAG: tetratricopeptide repeat protein [Verrucomicrobiaceae bacterium]
MKRWIFTLAALALVLAAAAFFWKKAATERRASTTMAAARSLLAKGRAADAQVLLQATKPPEQASPSRAAWFDLEVRTALANRQFELLRRLRDRDPDGFARNPEAVSWMERIAMARGDAIPDDAGPILTADKALQAGDAATARQVLESARFEGSDEVNRLTRLALLDADKPEKAWALISQAYAIDPKNPDVRTFSGNLLEQEGKPELARRDYVAAVVANPQNLRARDNLAEFYLRQQMLPQAVQTWLEAPPADGSALFYLKAWFWNRVGLGSVPINNPAVLGEAVASLAALPQGDFWGNDPGLLLTQSRVLADRAETLWLRVLQELRAGREPDALKLLSRASPQQAARHTFLRTTLEFLLAARTGAGGNPPPDIPEIKKSGHPFWKWLDENKSDPEALRQPWVLPALFCVSGWLRAGVDICKPEDLADTPEWAAYAVARSAQVCGDARHLADFLAASPSKSPAMQLLRGESEWADNRKVEGQKIFESLLGTPEAGYRAAFLLALEALARNDAAGVRRVIARQPDFAESVPGREFLARAALAEGKEDDALSIYKSLGDTSDDARIYLARTAYNAKDWGRAETLVRSLIADHPNEPAFADNLEKIQAAKKSQ